MWYHCKRQVRDEYCNYACVMLLVAMKGLLFESDLAQIAKPLQAVPCRQLPAFTVVHCGSECCTLHWLSK